jgi:hypothetical protein
VPFEHHAPEIPEAHTHMNHTYFHTGQEQKSTENARFKKKNRMPDDIERRDIKVEKN